MPCRLLHRHFLKAARRKRDVDAALRFVQLLPRENTDARTYNMLISVCAAARDAAAALRVADMWRSTGRQVDTMLYTNIIVGAAPPPCWLTALLLPTLTVRAFCLVLASTDAVRTHVPPSNFKTSQGRLHQLQRSLVSQCACAPLCLNPNNQGPQLQIGNEIPASVIFVIMSGVWSGWLDVGAAPLPSSSGCDVVAMSETVRDETGLYVLQPPTCAAGTDHPHCPV